MKINDPLAALQRAGVKQHFVTEDQALNFKLGRKNHPKDLRVKISGVTIGGKSPVTIAGPCAVESKRTFLSITKALSAQGTNLIRANIYKFRTLPSSFQGLGSKGRDILLEAKERYGISLVCEVLDQAQVESLMDVADVFQVGARSMMNSELLKTLGKAKKPVLLKRFFSATLGEFLAAAEYIATSGNKRIILCERGIRTFEPWMRFTPDIGGIAMLRSISCLPVIFDLSHSLGRTDVVLPVAKAALAVGANGIMTEVHARPEKAKSDKGQQLDISQYRQLVDKLGLSGK